MNTECAIYTRNQEMRLDAIELDGVSITLYQAAAPIAGEEQTQRLVDSCNFPECPRNDLKCGYVLQPGQNRWVEIFDQCNTSIFFPLSPDDADRISEFFGDES